MFQTSYFKTSYKVKTGKSPKGQGVEAKAKANADVFEAWVTIFCPRDRGQSSRIAALMVAIIKCVKRQMAGF